MICSQEVLEKILMPLAARSQQICPPKEKKSRPIFRTVRVLEGELNLAFLDLVHHVRNNLFIGGGSIFHGLFAQVQRIPIELRIGR